MRESYKEKLKGQFAEVKELLCLILPIMPALWFILNSAYYVNNYAGIFDTGLKNSHSAGPGQHGWQ